MPRHRAARPAPHAPRALIAARVSMYFTQAEEALWDTLADRLGIPPADAIHFCALRDAAHQFAYAGDHGLAALTRARLADVAAELGLPPDPHPLCHERASPACREGTPPACYEDTPPPGHDAPGAPGHDETEETDHMAHPDRPGSPGTTIMTPRLPDLPAPTMLLKRVFDGKVRRGRLTRTEADAEMARLGFRPDGTPIVTARVPAQPSTAGCQPSVDSR